MLVLQIRLVATFATMNYLNSIQLIRDCDLDGLDQMKMMAMAPQNPLDTVPKLVDRLLIRKMSVDQRKISLVQRFKVAEFLF